MSDYLQSDKAKGAWEAMRKNFKKDKKESAKSENGFFSKIKSMVSGPNAAEAATAMVERMKDSSEKKGKDKKRLLER
jgi:hypothetical protein